MSNFPLSTIECPPGPAGLYDPRHEHDACGVGFVVHIKGQRSHTIVEQGLRVLINLLHRGAFGSEDNTGDGAGILIQMPDRFLRKATLALGFTLPPAGQYGAGFVFLPREKGAREEICRLIERIVREEGQTVLGWRKVPTEDGLLGASAVAAEPMFEQLFIGAGPECAEDGPDRPARFERKLFVIRKRVEHAVDRLEIAERRAFYIPSLSSKRSSTREC
jgi:glutamate synthase (NADPH) large chain